MSCFILFFNLSKSACSEYLPRNKPAVAVRYLLYTSMHMCSKYKHKTISYVSCSVSTTFVFPHTTAGLVWTNYNIHDGYKYCSFLILGPRMLIPTDGWVYHRIYVVINRTGDASLTKLNSLVVILWHYVSFLLLTQHAV